MIGKKSSGSHDRGWGEGGGNQIANQIPLFYANVTFFLLGSQFYRQLLSEKGQQGV